MCPYQAWSWLDLDLDLDLETGTQPPSRPVVSAGSGQNDHLSEIISHILEPIVKMRPNGMEVTSTGDFVSRINDINEMVIPLETIDLQEIDNQLDEEEKGTLKEVDDHLEKQSKDAQAKYDKFDDDMARRSSKNILSGGGADSTLPRIPG